MLSGAVAGKFGFHTTVLGCGIYCLVISLIFAFLIPRLRNEAKPVYMQFGLLKSDVPPQLETTAAMRTHAYEAELENEIRNARRV
jgi:hypothetical protein